MERPEKSSKAIRDDIDVADDQESYFEYIEALPDKEEEEEEYQYDSDGNIVEVTEVWSVLRASSYMQRSKIKASWSHSLVSITLKLSIPSFTRWGPPCRAC